MKARFLKPKTRAAFFNIGSNEEKNQSENKI